MSSASADIYLILLRPSRVPVLGEAVSMYFQGQVLLESWSWDLTNDEEAKAGKASMSEFGEREKLITEASSAKARRAHSRDDFKRSMLAIEKAHEAKLAKHPSSANAAKQARDTKMGNLLKEFTKEQQQFDDDLSELYGGEKKLKAKTEDEQRAEAREKQVEELERNKNFEFKFTKRVDIATTQMLNSMKAGDVFPSATLTIHQRSANSGVTLVFNLQRIRLLEYNLSVVVTDTMTEMMEQWTCEFGSLAYVYKNAPAHYSSGNVGQAVAKAVSQGTMRAFAMKNLGSPI